MATQTIDNKTRNKQAKDLSMETILSYKDVYDAQRIIIYFLQERGVFPTMDEIKQIILAAHQVSQAYMYSFNHMLWTILKAFWGDTKDPKNELRVQYYGIR
jgi:hypothetical protein